MKKKNDRAADAELRRQAEMKLSERKKNATPPSTTEADTRRLVHELEVHQIELEMQNEELLQSRAQVEAGLRQYTDLYDFAPVGYFTLARDGAIHLVNLAGANLLGVERGKLIKRRFGVLVSVECRSVFNAFLEKVFLTSGSKETCEVVLQKDGAVPMWVHMEAITEDGQREACRAVVVDITERKRAEEELQKLSSTVEQTADSIVITNKDGIIEYVNPAFERLTGYTKEEVLGKTPRILKSGEQDQKYYEELWGTILSGRIFRAVVVNKKKNGELYYEEKTITPIVNKNGIITHFVSIDKDISERKRVDEAYKLAFSQLTNLYNNLPEAVFSVDVVQNKMLQVSPAHEAVFGYSCDEFFKNPQLWYEIIVPEDKPIVDAGYPILAAGKILQHQFRILRPDGKTRWIEAIIKPNLDENGKLVRLDGIALDITERKRADEELKRSEEKYRGIFENVQDVYYEASIDGTILEVSPSIESITKGQYHRDDLIGKSMYDFYSEAGERKALLSILKLQGSVADFEVTLKNHDGSLIPCSISSKMRFDAQGQPAKIVGSMRDITDRKQAEKQIAFLAHTLKSIVECVTVTDTNDTILFVNNAFLKTYGYNEDEILGKNANVLRSPNNRPEVTRGILAATLAGGWSGEVLNRTKDGRDFMVSLSTSFVRDEHGKVVALVGVATDITERKQSEEVKKILEAQLQQAQKLESIGTLASGIAHDFNNILGIILGYSTLLKRLRENPQQHSESVAAITKATQRGASLVKQLLIFARKTEALFETVSINDMIGEINKLLKETFPKTITISTSLQQDLPAIVADASQIHQVLLNLLVNARDAMPKSGTLSISTRTIGGEDVSSRFAKATGCPVTRQYVQIEVADTGIGMDETTRQRIFEPFFTTKGPGKGTGLGLAVVFGIVEHHSGFIDVRSAPGEGTTFTVYLPIPERAPEEVQVSRKDLEELPGGTETILIIEDEEMLRELVKASLVSKGYTVLTSEDGMQGVEMYERHQKEIAVVLSDIGLPLLSGQDVFNRIREINPRAKVILASGFFDPETKSQMYRAGLKNFIQKPYMQDEVLQKIREAIDTNG